MNATTFIIVGAKGGVGATTLSVHLARALSKSRHTTIMDADFSGRRSVAVLLDAIKTLDANRTDGNLTNSDITPALAAAEMAPNLHAGFTIRPEIVEVLAHGLAESGDLVIVDAPQPFAAAVRPFVVRASRFLLLVEPTVLGITSARATQLEMHRFGIPQSHICILTNLREPKPEVSRADVETALGQPVFCEIPNYSDRRFSRAADELVAKLLSISTSDPLALAPSTSSPLGDRRISKQRRPDAGAPVSGTQRAAEAPNPKQQDARDELKAAIHEGLSRRLNLVSGVGSETDVDKLEELRSQVSVVVQDLLNDRPDVGSAEQIAQLQQEVIDEALGLGPMEDLLHDEEVTEIMVNGFNQIYVERHGKIELTSKRFTNDAQLRLIIERIIAPIGRSIDESTPMVDARLRDGSRVNAIVEPLALDGPALTIRRFGGERLRADDLVSKGAVRAEIMDFLRACVEARLNIVISGGTGSGKTTFLNILSGYLPENERIVTIEDAAELKLDQQHVVRLESRPPNIEGRGEIRIRDLVRNSLRMRPDRIIVGECRGGEALDMLQAMNTGHDGSLTTIHANSPRDCVSRIETMVLMAGFDLPIRAIREQIAGALDLVVQTARMRDGTRKITSISEVVGMEGDVVTMQEIVRFEQRGLDKESNVVGQFVFSGVQPNCLRRFEEYGISFDVRTLSALGLPAASW